MANTKSTKHKLGDVAKDLNVPMKDLVDMLSTEDNEKKRTTALSSEELNLVFETYTKKNSVDNFDSYFASAKQEPKKEEPVKAEPKAEAKAAPKAEPKAEVKEEKKAEMQEEKKVEAEEVKETPKQNKPQGERTQNDRPQGERKFDKPQGDRFQNQQAKPQQPKPAKPAPTRPAIDPSKRTDDGTGVRVVDMRSTNVDLDKYNERYENIAPGNMMSKAATAPNRNSPAETRRKTTSNPKRIKKLKKCANWRWNVNVVRNCPSPCRKKSPLANWL